MSSPLSGRVFLASLKPVWSKKRLKDFCESLVGSAVVFAINHDKDFNEHGVVVEPHTHFLIEYATPRKISTVANLLGVESNFIQIAHSKKASLRYLTHLDDEDKFRYSSEEIISNSTVPYDDLILGQSMSDKEIAKYIREGRGEELFGVVSASKLRTIQSFIHFDLSNKMYAKMNLMSQDIAIMTNALKEIQDVVLDFQKGFTQGVTNFIPHMVKISEAAEKALLRIK